MRKLLFFLLFTIYGICYAQWQQVTQIPTREISTIQLIDDVLYAGADSLIYISSDGGDTWNRSGLLSGDTEIIPAITKFNGKLFAGTFGHGVFTSSDSGATWQPLSSGLNGLGAKSISSFTTQNGALIVGTQGAGTFKLDSMMQSWSPVGNLPLEIAGTVYAMTERGDTVIAGAGASGYIYRLLPGSVQWEYQDFSGGLHMTALSFAWIDNDVYAAASLGVYRSSNNGETWDSVGTGWLGSIECWLAYDGNTLHAAVNKLGYFLVFRSTDRGETWSGEDPISGASFGLAVHGDRLYCARLDGLWYRTLTVSSVDEHDPRVPAAWSLEQNYPNPFNPETVIHFRLPVSGSVSLKVYNLLGQEIATLANRELTAGEHRVAWNAAGYASGMYFYRLETEYFAATKPMLLLK
ncbi:MAG: T9SS type A sorting domain-containing protein [Ignavibacteriae bacterium]|nr:T9SS type A sorting domain-containing protein [Ignavibacteriota bacterium]